MDFTKKQIHPIPAFWFQKDEVEETQVCFESISLKSPFALWTLFVPVWRRAGQHVIRAMVVMAHKEHLSPSHLHYIFILLGWKTYQRTKTMTEKYFIVCGSKGKRYGFFFLCELCKLTLPNFAAWSMENCTTLCTTLILSTNIWKSTK